MGNNQHGNPQVRAGKLRYNCLKRAPTHTDEFGGRACMEPDDLMMDDPELVFSDPLMLKIENLHDTLYRDMNELVSLLELVSEDVHVEKPPAKSIANVRTQAAIVRRRLASLDDLLKEIE